MVHPYCAATQIFIYHVLMDHAEHSLSLMLRLERHESWRQNSHLKRNSCSLCKHVLAAAEKLWSESCSEIHDIPKAWLLKKQTHPQSKGRNNILLSYLDAFAISWSLFSCPAISQCSNNYRIYQYSDLWQWLWFSKADKSVTNFKEMLIFFAILGLLM